MPDAGIPESPIDLAAIDVGGGGDADGGSGVDDPGDCSILYVSPQGEDGHSGCSPSAAKRTIGSVSALGKEVHVCKGSYQEGPVTVTGTLKGAYDCMSWTRTAGYGYPLFDGTNETVISPGQAGAVVTVQGDATTILIDGFTIIGPTTGTNASSALGVTGNASGNPMPKIANNRILGGATTSQSGTGSIGITATLSLEITQNYIDGGSGTGSGTGKFGSVGIVAAGGTGPPLIARQGPHIHLNQIHGGSGTGTNDSGGSAGLVLQELGNFQGPAAVENNEIDGGSGSTTTASSPSTCAVCASGNRIDVDVISNSIDGGHARVGSAGSTFGVQVLDIHSLNARRNRIYGGVGPGATGIMLREPGNIGHVAWVINNMIHAGIALDSSYPHQSLFLQSVDGGGVYVQHNTMIGGGGAQSSVTHIHLDASATKTYIENNLFAATDTMVTAVLAEGCANKGAIASFIGNTTSNMRIFAYGDNPDLPCVANGSFATDDATVAELTSKCTSSTTGPCASFTGTKATNDMNIRAACISDSGCIAFANCDSPGACLQAIFQSWDTATNGESDLFGNGWLLRANAPCGIVADPYDSRIVDDLFGHSRTKTPSAGAYESQDKAQCQTK
jgi:hypothetical protein